MLCGTAALLTPSFHPTTIRARATIQATRTREKLRRTGCGDSAARAQSGTDSGLRHAPLPVDEQGSADDLQEQEADVGARRHPR